MSRECPGSVCAVSALELISRARACVCGSQEPAAFHRGRSRARSLGARPLTRSLDKPLRAPLLHRQVHEFPHTCRCKDAARAPRSPDAFRTHTARAPDVCLFVFLKGRLRSDSDRGEFQRARGPPARARSQTPRVSNHHLSKSSTPRVQIDAGVARDAEGVLHLPPTHSDRFAFRSRLVERRDVSSRLRKGSRVPTYSRKVYVGFPQHSSARTLECSYTSLTQSHRPRQF